jgi:hypothetical protein
MVLVVLMVIMVLVIVDIHLLTLRNAMHTRQPLLKVRDLLLELAHVQHSALKHLRRVSLECPAIAISDPAYLWERGTAHCTYFKLELAALCALLA